MILSDATHFPISNDPKHFNPYPFIIKHAKYTQPRLGNLIVPKQPHLLALRKTSNSVISVSKRMFRLTPSPPSSLSTFSKHPCLQKRLEPVCLKRVSGQVSELNYLRFKK